MPSLPIPHQCSASSLAVYTNLWAYAQPRCLMSLYMRMIMSWPALLIAQLKTVWLWHTRQSTSSCLLACSLNIMICVWELQSRFFKDETPDTQLTAALFHKRRCMQFIFELTNSVENLTGSPVQVTIDSITAGSVKVANMVAFLDGNSSSASIYSAVLSSGDTSSIYGASFGDVTVDKQSVTTAFVNNPSKWAGGMQLTLLLSKEPRHVTASLWCTFRHTLWPAMLSSALAYLTKLSAFLVCTEITSFCEFECNPIMSTVPSWTWQHVTSVTGPRLWLLWSAGSAANAASMSLAVIAGAAWMMMMLVTAWQFQICSLSSRLHKVKISLNFWCPSVHCSSCIRSCHKVTIVSHSSAFVSAWCHWSWHPDLQH